MKIPTIRNVPTPSALLSDAHTLYDNLSASITRMAASFDREDELWPQFQVSVQAITDAFKMYVGLETRTSSWDLRRTWVEGSRRVSSSQPQNL